MVSLPNYLCQILVDDESVVVGIGQITSSIDGTARLWDLTAKIPGASSIVLECHEEVINSIAVSPDSRWLATASSDATVRLWDITAKDPAAHPIILQGHADIVSSVAFSSDGRRLVTGSRDNTVRVWNLAAADPQYSPLVLRGPENGESDKGPEVAISSDGRWVVGRAMGNPAGPMPRLWDLSAADPNAAPRDLAGHTAIISCMTLSSDGRWLLTSGGNDRTVRVWDLTADDPSIGPIVLSRYLEGYGVAAMVLSPNGRWLATVGQKLLLWDLTLPDPSAAEPQPKSVGYDKGVHPG